MQSVLEFDCIYQVSWVMEIVIIKDSVAREHHVEKEKLRSTKAHDRRCSPLIRCGHRKCHCGCVLVSQRWASHRSHGWKEYQTQN